MLQRLFVALVAMSRARSESLESTLKNIIRDNQEEQTRETVAQWQASRMLLGKEKRNCKAKCSSEEFEKCMGSVEFNMGSWEGCLDKPFQDGWKECKRQRKECKEACTNAPTAAPETDAPTEATDAPTAFDGFGRRCTSIPDASASDVTGCNTLEDCLTSTGCRDRCASVGGQKWAIFDSNDNWRHCGDEEPVDNCEVLEDCCTKCYCSDKEDCGLSTPGKDRDVYKLQ